MHLNFFKRFRHSRKNGSVLVICLAFCCIVGVLIFLFNTDSFRYARNLYVFMGNAETFLNSSPRRSSETGSWSGMDERQFVESEDPGRTRLLSNNIDEYRRVDNLDEEEDFIHETIALKVSQNRIRLGGKVTFEAILSPEMPRAESRIMLYSNSLSKTTTLGRAGNRKYKGFFRFAKSDAGEFRFFTAFPRKDDKTGALALYGSNSVSVFVTPDPAKLTRIFFQETPRNQPIVLQEGQSVQPTLIAESKNDLTFVITNPGIGTVYSITDESRAIVSDDGSIVGKASGETVLTAYYGHLQTEAKIRVFSHQQLIADLPPDLDLDKLPPAPRVIRPADGSFMQKGTPLILEISSFDTSTGFRLLQDGWKVQRYDEETRRYLPITDRDAFPPYVKAKEPLRQRISSPAMARIAKEAVNAAISEHEITVVTGKKTKYEKESTIKTSSILDASRWQLSSEEREKILRGKLMITSSGKLYKPGEDPYHWLKNFVEWTPVRPGTYRWSVHYYCYGGGRFENTDASPWTYFTVFEKGSAPGEAAPRGPEYMPGYPRRPASRPYAVEPADGIVVHKGEKVILEASSFDAPKGHIFNSSSWEVGKVRTYRGKEHAYEIAYLRGGNDNTAEWVPRGTGTFEWTVSYSYSGGRTERSLPRRIIVVE